MLTQCVNFQYMSEGFFKNWRKSNLTKVECDWRETTDMVEWQALVATIPVKGTPPNAWPKFGPGFSLATIVSAHHNLVIYGVPFHTASGAWTNPGPEKRFYAPEDAIRTLAKSVVLKDDADVKKYLQEVPAENLDLPGKPGMKEWVEKTGKKAKLHRRGTEAEAKAWQVWKEWHEKQDTPTVEQE